MLEENKQCNIRVRSLTIQNIHHRFSIFKMSAIWAHTLFENNCEGQHCEVLNE